MNKNNVFLIDGGMGQELLKRGLKAKGTLWSASALIDKKIKLYQPTNLKEKSFISILKSYKSDLYIVVAFRMIPETVWSIPKIGTFNLHASLLPEYRGAAPINWVLINQESFTGLTTFMIDNKIDTGKILLQSKYKIKDGETYDTLHDNLLYIGTVSYTHLTLPTKRIV